MSAELQPEGATPRSLSERLARRLGIRDALCAWLPSQRPAWAMMPRSNAALLVETLLTTVSVLEQHAVAYTVHQGSLLGAARLRGLLPWDIDADLAIEGECAETVIEKLEAPLRAHGLALLFSPEHYYFTIRPFVAAPGQGTKPLLLIPLVEVILLTPTRDAQTGELWQDRHAPHRMFASGELRPYRRYPWHGSYVLGPANAEPVLRRLYGSSASPEAMRDFSPAILPEETLAFWRRARPLDGEPDWEAIRARATDQQGQWARRFYAAPWYLANGLYNTLTESVRRAVGGR